MGGRPIILSLDDLKSACRSKLRLLMLVAFALGLCLFLMRLNREPSYTATALFKGIEKTNPTNPLSELFAGTMDIYLFEDDALYFLKAPPVLENAIRALHLQGHIAEPQRRFPLQNWFHNLAIERATLRFKKKVRPTSLISIREAVPNRLLLKDRSSTLVFTELSYTGELFERLTLRFDDEQHFTLLSGKKELGHGELDQPFLWERGSFTLHRNQERSLARRSLSLTFTPLPALVKSLQSALVIKREKEHRKCLRLFYTHSDRHLAAALLNAIMGGYSQFLSDQGRLKVEKQLAYFASRQQDLRNELTQIVQKKVDLLEQNQSAGGIADAELSNQSLFAIQAQVLNERALLEKELLQLSQHLISPDLKTPQALLAYLQAHEEEFCDEETKRLTIEGARSLLLSQQTLLEGTRSRRLAYEFYLAKHEDPSLRLSPLIDEHDPLVLRLFEKIGQAQMRLIDVHNFSEKEQEILKAQLATDRACLMQHLQALIESCRVKESSLYAKTTQLQRALLVLLSKQNRVLDNFLAHLWERAKVLPWHLHADNQLKAECATHEELLQSLASMVEAKNMGYNTEWCESGPLMLAMAPTLPNSPKLLLAFLMGCIGGALLFLLFLFVKALWRGPLPTATNLLAMGLQCRGSFLEPTDLAGLSKEERAELNALLSATRDRPLLLFGVSGQSLYPACAAALLAKEESTLLIKGLLPGSIEPFSWIEEEGTCTLMSPLPLAEVVRSSAFHQFLESKRKSGQRLVVAFDLSCEVGALPLLAGLAPLIYIVTDESTDELLDYPKETLFVIRKEAPSARFDALAFVSQQKQLHLRQIQPLLDQLKEEAIRSRRLGHLLFRRIKKRVRSI